MAQIVRTAAPSAKINLKWTQNLRNGFFDIEPFLVSYPQLPGFNDFFTTNLGLDPYEHVPALPLRYAPEFNEERVMYLFGVPRKMTRDRLQSILSDLGGVERLPMVTDLVSKETFRWAVMNSKEEATRLHKVLQMMKVPECEGTCIIAVTPCKPGRGLLMSFHRQHKSFEGRPLDDSLPIYGQKIDIPDDMHALYNFPEGSIQKSTSTQCKYSGLDPLAASFETPTRAEKQRNPLMRSFFQGNGDPKELARTIKTEVGYPQQKNTVQQPNPLVPAQVSAYESSTQNRTRTPIPKSLDTLLMFLRGNDTSKTISLESVMESTMKKGPSRSSTFSKGVAIPEIVTTGQRALAHINTTRSVTPAVPCSLAKEIRTPAELMQESRADTVDREDEDIKTSTSEFSPIAAPAAAVSSWASIANAGPETKVIDIAPASAVHPTNRLRAIGRIPSGPNPSKTEPLADQMRVVFILDIPFNLTYDDVSHAVQEGPLRSIHFGLDEEKNSRFTAIVFQHAKDASLFVKALQKERVDSRPERFRWVVEVARGEEPFPLDDVLRAMQPPTLATRRLTLVKASLFFMVGERQLRARIERIVGEGTIQLIWLYNGGNATIVFSDVSSAIAVKDEFDRYSATAGKPDGAPQAWAGLQTTFSKDPCVQPLDLKTALHD